MSGGRQALVVWSVCSAVWLAALVAAPASAVAVDEGDEHDVAEPTVAVPALVAGSGEDPAVDDLESALLAAAALDAPVEALELTSEVERHVAQPDGTVAFEVHAAPVRVSRDDGWVPVDTSLAWDADRLAPEAAVIGVSLSGGGTDELLTLSDQDGLHLGISWPDALPTPEVSGDTATYVGVLPDVDLIARVHADSVELLVKVASPAAAANPELARIEWGVSTEGLSMNVGADGSVDAVDSSGAVVFTAPPSLMWDSPRQQPELELFALMGEPLPWGYESEPGRIEVMDVELDDGVLAVVPSQQMLTDPDTTYPVYLDPNFGFNVNNWAPVHKSRPTTSWSSGTTNPREVMRVGYNPWAGCGSNCGVWRSHIRFSISAISGNGYRLVGNPKLVVPLVHAASSSSTPVSLWRTNSIGSSGATWNSMSDKWLTNFGTKSAKSSDAPKDLSWSTSAMKDKLQSAMNSGNSTFTFGLRAPNEGDSHQWKKFARSGSYLSGTYNSVPAVPTSVKVKSDCAGSCVSGGKVRVTRPYLQAKVSNPLGGNVTAEFEVRNHATNAVVHSGTRTVSNNATAEWRLPSALTNGTKYKFRVRAKNSDGITGSWSSYYVFTIDTSGPSQPSAVGVSSTGDCYGSCTSGTMLNNRRPTFKATTGHPFGDNLSVAFEVQNSATGATVASGTVNPVTAGTTPTWRPSSSLPQETTMRLRVRSTDAYSRNSSWSSWYTFTVDTNPPNTPTVSSAVYLPKSTGTWNGGVGHAASFSFGPNGSNDVVRYEWRFNGGGVSGKNVSKGTSTTVSLTPPGDLEQRLQVRSIDHAGNVSGWRDYHFYVRPQPADAGYWKFDEGSGTVAACSISGCEVSGVLNGTATWAASGINPANPSASGNAVSLNGSSGAFVEMAPVIATNHSAGFSVSAWVKPTSLAGTQSVVSLDGDATSMFLLHKSSGNEWCVRATGSDDPNSDQVVVCSDIAPQVGVWTHLVGVYDRPAGKVRLYVNGGPNNGEQQSGTVTEADAPASWAADRAMRVGASTSGGSRWNGLIDEVRAHQRVLDESEVVHVYGSCLVATCPTVPPPDDLMLVGAWDFEETSGGLAADSSGMNNHATLGEGSSWTAFGHGGGRGLWSGHESSYAATVDPVVLTDRSFTVAGWVRLDELSTTEQWLLQTEGANSSAMKLYYRPLSDAWRFSVRGASGGSWHHATATSGAVSVAEWIHLAGVYDASADQIRLYVNGELNGEASGIPAVDAATSGLYLGGGYDHGLLGTLDTVRAYQGAASSAQIAAWYAEQVADPSSEPSALAVDWRMDDGNGPSAFDHTWMGNDGWLTGGASWLEAGEAFAGTYGVRLDGQSGTVASSWTPVLTDESFSVSAWVRLDDRTEDRAAVSVDGQHTSALSIYHDATLDRYCVRMAHQDASETPVSAACAAISPAVGAWTHLVGTFSKNERRIKLYIDGQLAAAATYDGLEPWQAEGLLVAGRALVEGNQVDWWTGGVARVQAYHGALSPAAVEDLFEGQSDRRPTAVIETPAEGVTWTAGQQVAFTGRGVDVDGELPASALTWELRVRDCADRTDPDCQVDVLDSWTGVHSGEFTAPTDATPVYLELELTVTNENGASSTALELDPETTVLAFETTVEDLELAVGEVTAQAPFEVTMVEGSEVSISAPVEQHVDEVTYVLVGWEHGGDPDQLIVVSDQDSTFVAEYRVFDLVPVAEITSPSTELTWSPGQQITVAGQAANTESLIPEDQLSWQAWVEYCVAPDDCHLDLIQSWENASGGSFAAPDIPYADAFMNIELTAHFDEELIDVATVVLIPETVELTFASNPAGLELIVNGEAEKAPFTRTVVQGATIELIAAEYQELGGSWYTFEQWGHGGGRAQEIVAPTDATDYWVSYSPSQSAGSIEGTVYCDESPLGYSEVSLATQDAWIEASTSEQGAYRFDDLGAGTYTLSVFPNGRSRCEDESFEVVVASGAVAIVDIHLESQW